MNSFIQDLINYLLSKIPNLLNICIFSRENFFFLRRIILSGRELKKKNANFIGSNKYNSKHFSLINDSSRRHLRINYRQFALRDPEV